MNTAIIVAGGKGSRMGEKLPKQFIKVHGKPIIIICLEAFERHREIDEIIVVCMDGYIEYLKTLARKFYVSKLKTVTAAGSTRYESVLSGLNAVNDHGGIVLIHDAVRPLVSSKIISDNIAGARKHGAIITAMPSIDTIFRSEDGEFVSDTLQRRELYRAQTPQSFQYGIIMDAYLKCSNTPGITDDCAVALAAGCKPAICIGDEMNFKITVPEDLEKLSFILNGIR